MCGWPPQIDDNELVLAPWPAGGPSSLTGSPVGVPPDDHLGGADFPFVFRSLAACDEDPFVFRSLAACDEEEEMASEVEVVDTTDGKSDCSSYWEVLL